MVGHVETHIDHDPENQFFGVCEMAVPGESVTHGFTLGSIGITVTALIIGDNDKLYAYSPKDAIDFPWKMMESEGAEIHVDADHNITLRSIPEMDVASLQKW
jgi:hypothetical protein